jgi:hypothetical protein
MVVTSNNAFIEKLWINYGLGDRPKPFRVGNIRFLKFSRAVASLLSSFSGLV